MAGYLGFKPVPKGNFYFISYNNDDAPRIAEIALALKEKGIPMWYDNGLSYGDSWESTISSMIAQSIGLVFFFTESMLAKKESYAIKEFRMATNMGKRVIVFSLDPIDSVRLCKTYPHYAWFIDELAARHAPRSTQELISALNATKPRKPSTKAPEPKKEKKEEDALSLVLHEDQLMWVNFNNPTYPDEKKKAAAIAQIARIKALPVAQQKQLNLKLPVAKLSYYANIPIINDPEAKPKPPVKGPEKPAPKPEPKPKEKPAPKEAKEEHKTSDSSKDENMVMTLHLLEGDGHYEKGIFGKTKMINFRIRLHIENKHQYPLKKVTALVSCGSNKTTIELPHNDDVEIPVDVEEYYFAGEVKVTVTIRYKIGFAKIKELSVTAYRNI